MHQFLHQPQLIHGRIAPLYCLETQPGFFQAQKGIGQGPTRWCAA